MADHVVSATKCNDGTSRPQNRNQKNWHIELLVVVSTGPLTNGCQKRFDCVRHKSVSIGTSSFMRSIRANALYALVPSRGRTHHSPARRDAGDWNEARRTALLNGGPPSSPPAAVPVSAIVSSAGRALNYSGRICCSAEFSTRAARAGLVTAEPIVGRMRCRVFVAKNKRVDAKKDYLPPLLLRPCSVLTE
jgi:hypothetical protein